MATGWSKERARSPRKAQPHVGTHEAWFYENRKSIDVYVRKECVAVLSCRIPRAKLVEWIKRTEPKP